MLELLIVVEIFAHLLQHHPTTTTNPRASADYSLTSLTRHADRKRREVGGRVLDVFKHTPPADGFGEIACMDGWVSAGLTWEEGNGLVGSSIRRMAPATQAADLRMTNSKPSLETRVTYSAGGEAIAMCGDEIEGL